MPRLRVSAAPIHGGEIIAVAVMTADRTGIGVGIEPDDIALHGGLSNVPADGTGYRAQAIVAKRGAIPRFRLALSRYHSQLAGRS